MKFTQCHLFVQVMGIALGFAILGRLFSGLTLLYLGMPCVTSQRFAS